MFSSSEDSGDMSPWKKTYAENPLYKTTHQFWIARFSTPNQGDFALQKITSHSHPGLDLFIRMFFFWIFKARADTEKPTPIGDERSDLDQKKK